MGCNGFSNGFPTTGAPLLLLPKQEAECQISPSLHGLHRWLLLLRRLQQVSPSTPSRIGFLPALGWLVSMLVKDFILTCPVDLFKISASLFFYRSFFLIGISLLLSRKLSAISSYLQTRLQVFHLQRLCWVWMVIYF